MNTILLDTSGENYLRASTHFARNLREFGVAGSEESEVKQWIVLDSLTLSSQSERAKKLSIVLVYTK